MFTIDTCKHITYKNTVSYRITVGEDSSIAQIFCLCHLIHCIYMYAKAIFYICDLNKNTCFPDINTQTGKVHEFYHKETEFAEHLISFI